MNATSSPELKEIEPEVRKGIDECVDRWKDKEGNLIMILHEIQNQHGYVPREASLLLAEKTGVPMARIYEVITFYHYFRLVPQGKHNVTVCNGTACYLKGSGRLLNAFERKLKIKDGETSNDRLFHLETVRCIGCCGMSPALVIDKNTLGKMVPENIEKIVDDILKTEQTNEN